MVVPKAGAELVVSIIVPCRNEGKFIRLCLDSIIANDYPHDCLEVLVVDGMSEDETHLIAEAYAKQFPFIWLLDNRKQITPAALNIGIRNAKGNVIVRIDAHARLKEDYISQCVRFLDRSGADNVGGIMVTLPREEDLIGKAIVSCLSHPFGVGNSYFRVHAREPKWVDTVFGGCYRREVFTRIGLFNEDLERGQDMEFNLRLKNAGGKILLVPDIVSYYHARSDLRSFWTHNWSNGVWAVLPFLYSPIMPVSWRHLVPLLFVISLIGSVVLGFLATPLMWLFLLIGGAYSAATLAASFHIAWRDRDPRFLLLMPLMFSTLHIGYGLGSLWGVLKLLRTPQFWAKLFRVQARCERTTG